MIDAIEPAPLDIRCAVLAPFDRAELDDVANAFRDATPISLRQAWLPQPSPDLAAGSIRMGFRDHVLFVFAELEDRDVFTRVTGHNQRFWELGDTFEMFFRPADQDAYVEFHVAPNNRRLQLRFADGSWLTREPRIDPFAQSIVEGDLFQSRTWTSHAGKWSVLAEIPRASVSAGAEPLAGSVWTFSFGRYDYTRGSSEPVLSSTSPHAEAAFHRQHEWGTVRFAAPDSIDDPRRPASSVK